MIEYKDRVTNKFKASKNFNNILDFLTEYDSDSLLILNDMNNMDSEYGIILDEIGKTLGIYPRPLVPRTLGGYPTVFTYDLSLYDTVPYADDIQGAYRSMSNKEYSKVLRVFAKMINFKGTMQEWEDILFILTGAVASFSNKASSFGITIPKSLGVVEKAIVEFTLKYNLLTVNIDYIGTTNGGQPFKYDVSQYDTSEYVKPW